MKKFLMVLCGFVMIPLWAQVQKYSWDFSDCEIRDILFAVSLDTGFSIVADDTVKGTGTFKFVGDDFEKAFDSFLATSRLYVSKNDGLWTVSRCRVEVENDLISLDVFDLSPSQILDKISVVVEKPISFDSLPNNHLTMHFRNLNEIELLEKICMYFSGYQVNESESGYHFSKKNNSRIEDFSDSDIVFEFEENDGVFVDVRNGKFSEVINKFFEFIGTTEKVSFCLLSNGEGKIARSTFVAKNFDDALVKICEQNGFARVLVDGIYYIVSSKNSREKLVTERQNWCKYKLNYLKAENFVSFVNKKVGSFEYVVLPDEFSVLFKVSEMEDAEIKDLINHVDIKTETYLLTLKYITPAELIKFLPPSVDKNSIFVADDNSCVYFKGTEEAYKNVCKEISLCDRPVQRISYDLLILQYDESFDNQWNPNFKIEPVKLGNRNNLGFQLGSVLNLNLDVISTFGLKFAASLQASIEENDTQVFADTTLHGVSGKKINFQNTNTYRYRDNNIDPETGKPIFSGVTREIVSGIKIDILGRVSGDGMITSSVTASVTRQGVDTSASTGNPPPTTEKIVTTEVCGKSGEVVVLSGLIQNSESEIQSRTPVVSKIPILGNLFKKKEKILEKSQMIIYLVPHLERSLEDGSGSKTESGTWEDELWIKEKAEELLRDL